MCSSGTSSRHSRLDRDQWVYLWINGIYNVLNYLPTSLQTKAKQGLQAIWMADTRTGAHRAFDRFVETYDAKRWKAARCLEKDRDALLAFYDFPDEHWMCLRTTNPIESTLAAIRHSADRANGRVTRRTTLTMLFELGKYASKNWRKVRGLRS